MVRSSVLGCRSDSERKLPNVFTINFPVSNDIRVRWIEATGRSNWTPKKSSRICSRHFEQNALFKKRKATVLFPDAVPILETKIIATPSKSSVVQDKTRRFLVIKV